MDTCSYISLDGITVPGRFLLGDGIASRSGARADQYRERPFKFMKIPDNGAHTSTSISDALTITLLLQPRATWTRTQMLALSCSRSREYDGLRIRKPTRWKLSLLRSQENARLETFASGM